MQFYINDEKWLHKFNKILKQIEKILDNKIKPVIKKESIYPKIIIWDDEIKTIFYNKDNEENNTFPKCFVKATGVIKINSIFKLNSNYYLQIYLHECKYKKSEIIKESLLNEWFRLIVIFFIIFLFIFLNSGNSKSTNHCFNFI